MMKASLLPLLLVACLAQVHSTDGLFGTVQSAAVRGRLICNGKPSVGTKVKLYDTDRFDIDDKMAEGKSDRNGEFYLAGNAKEMTSIDPKLNIYHNCNDEKIPCLIKISIEIPDNYITTGAIPSKVFDAGVLNLDGKFSGQSRDCINK